MVCIIGIHTAQICIPKAVFMVQVVEQAIKKSRRELLTVISFESLRAMFQCYIGINQQQQNQIAKTKSPKQMQRWQCEIECIPIFISFIVYLN